MSFKEKFINSINILSHFKSFCQTSAESFLFWFLVAVFIIIEPVLCANFSYGYNYQLQKLTLVISTVLFVIQLIGVATLEWDRIINFERLMELGNRKTFSIKSDTSARRKGVSTSTIEESMTFVNMFKFFTHEGEYIFEFCCLAGGWATIYTHPGLASLRCFRVLRLLWFYEVKIIKSTAEHYLFPVFGKEFVSMIFKLFKFAIKALSALGNEMFRLTEKTRGALLLMLIFFYSAFVLGIAILVETSTSGGDDDTTTNLCSAVGDCTYTLMRLTFFDGNGFDLVWSLTTNHIFLFFCCILYMCITSFGILNGLVGIFGTAIAMAANQAFEETIYDEDDDNGVEDNNDDNDDDISTNNILNNNDNNNDDIDLNASDKNEPPTMSLLRQQSKLLVSNSNGASSFALKQILKKEFEKEKLSKLNTVNEENISISTETIVRKKTLKDLIGKHFIHRIGQDAYVVPEEHSNNNHSSANIALSSPGDISISSNNTSFNNTITPSKSFFQSENKNILNNNSPNKSFLNNQHSFATKSNMNMVVGGLFTSLHKDMKRKAASNNSANDIKSYNIDLSQQNARITNLENKIIDQTITITNLSKNIELLVDTLLMIHPELNKNHLQQHKYNKLNVNAVIQEANESSDTDESVDVINNIDSNSVHEFLNDKS